MPGSWQYQPYLTTYDSFIFYNAIGEHPDYFYRPIAVAKQVVNGTNYRFSNLSIVIRRRLRNTLRSLIIWIASLLLPSLITPGAVM